jgi:hypothetical protein
MEWGMAGIPSRRVRGLATGAAGATLRALALAVCAERALAVCPDAPASGCETSHQASLRIDERRPGNEKLALALRRIVGHLQLDVFGDPVGGSSRLAFCLYDEADALVAERVVDRAGAACAGEPCWEPFASRHVEGFSYADPDASAGFSKIKERLYATQAVWILASARNRVARGESGLPTGLAAALAGQSQARVQILVSDGACFDAQLADVRRADGVRFEARGP